METNETTIEMNETANSESTETIVSPEEMKLEAEELPQEEPKVEASAEPKKERPTPAYVAFVAALQAKAEMLGLGVKEQKGYYQFKNNETGHRMVVAKQGKAVTRIDTTLEVLGQEGTYALEVPNGRITCHIEANPEIAARYLEVLAQGSEKIRAPKRTSKPKAEEPAAQASA